MLVGTGLKLDDVVVVVVVAVTTAVVFTGDVVGCLITGNAFSILICGVLSDEKILSVIVWDNADKGIYNYIKQM